ncbi:16S rRNA (guanine(527)-N(7))-methyltransferase RsmG [Aquincola sp. J276]|uniref:16S rRNA (guanine(527)-N(7))-methyltransferase RsmG n=1 Tax=Aquincola sp. J276 TaxID=2898432 RepID=UPI00215107E6|nr:16S rRNA (guanine(527)-N(7))-methyltransferase RsmG [Aquincola sp. J276]MCR5866149.1 16S rRNA (guanine(527)-N(7))-methyltransferase RsmG [Aquincola sp. J276]
MAGNVNTAPLREPLQQGLRALGCHPGSEAEAEAVTERLLAYLDLISRWNRVYNLTAVRDPQDMLTQHLLDSLSVVQPLAEALAGQTGEAANRVLDVGSGAGLPGVVISILRPELTVVCVDAVAKKARFIQQVATELGLRRLHAQHTRIEDLDTPPFGVVTSRAFASLVDFVMLTRRQLAPRGLWMAMKGRAPDEELAALPPDVIVTGVQPLQVPGLDAQRCLVWMRPAAA